MVNLDKINELVDQKYISVQKHPEDDLYIYNYTQRCQFDRHWTPETLICRGLILDKSGKIIARPFKKFFNLSEHQADDMPDIPLEDFNAYKKLDGSLGILYWINDTPYIATRGSFVSEQAIWATKIFRKFANYNFFQREYTYLFEIVVSWNRIVVQYDWEGLALLAIIKTKDGKKIDIPNNTWEMQARVPRYDGGKYIHKAPHRMETVPRMPQGIKKERQGEAQGKEKREYKEVEGEKRGEIKGTREKRLFEGASLYRQDKRINSMQKLPKELSSLRNGLSPQKSEKENVERGQMQEFRKNKKGNKEMRYSLLQLPQNKDLARNQIIEFRVAEKVDISNLEEIPAVDNEEGYVIHFKSGLMVKVKFDEYVRLHRLITEVNAKTIWDLLRNEENFDELLDRVPDEFFNWVKTTKRKLEKEFAMIMARATLDFTDIIRVMGLTHAIGNPYKKYIRENLRKEFAERAVKTKYPSIMFSMLDERPVDHLIWKMIRPKAEKPFKEEI